ncbi:hypothetical protein PHYPSEUDO_011311 [Phytophthora pseudosyringae]|uniref:Uncharacterized protein n=1 Tax=Phytophthora pseudosyringae TaxID=221518 RepID=A0A8T1W531_9STRA|nr:hypothetical protein PHYPSEUDO_011311 [Phytophthora pseudosyringae]
MCSKFDVGHANVRSPEIPTEIGFGGACQKQHARASRSGRLDEGNQTSDTVSDGVSLVKRLVTFSSQVMHRSLGGRQIRAQLDIRLFEYMKPILRRLETTHTLFETHDRRAEGGDLGFCEHRSRSRMYMDGEVRKLKIALESGSCSVALRGDATEVDGHLMQLRLDVPNANLEAIAFAECPIELSAVTRGIGIVVRLKIAGSTFQDGDLVLKAPGSTF